MPKQRLFTFKSGMCSTPNSDTIHCLITCQFTGTTVQIIEHCSGLKGDCKNPMLISASNQQSSHPELCAAAR